jgi:hypothetical protein
MINHQDLLFTVCQMASIFTKLLMKGATSEIAVKVFEVTGK